MLGNSASPVTTYCKMHRYTDFKSLSGLFCWIIHAKGHPSSTALPRLLPSFTPTGLCFDSLMIGMHAWPHAVPCQLCRFSIKNITVWISLLGLTLTRLSSDMSGFLRVLKTGQAGTRSESLSNFILGLSFSAWSCHRAVITERLLA